MKKTQKRIFGFFGLFVVVVMTIIAAMIPSPGASANSSSSFTDEIHVRVVGSVISVKFEKPSENTVTTSDSINLIFNYENADTARLALSYIDKDGGTVNLPNFKLYPDLDYGAGAKSETINVSDFGFSYGKYVLSLYATGTEGTEVLYDSVSVEYVPVIASAEQNEDDGLVDLSIDSYADEVEKVEIYIDGQLIKTVSKDDFDKIIKLDLGEKATGEYTIEVVAKDANGETLYKPYEVTVQYEGIDVPNTGTFFQNLNISREDYLVTGLIVFFVFGIVALGIVAKGSKRR